MSDQIKVLTVGIQEETIGYVKSILKEAEFSEISDMEGFEKLLEQPPPGPFVLIFTGPGLGDAVAFTELAQSIRMSYSSSPIFFITNSREGYDRKNFIKNGFDDAFLIPLDEKTLKLKIEDILAQVENIDLDIFRPVKLVDLQADTKLGFDVSIFMPVNKKYIKYQNADDDVSQERIDKLTKHQVSSLYVPLKQMKKFYDYTASKLVDLNGKKGQISETERQERLHSAVRDIFSNVFNVGTGKDANIGEGKKIVEDCSQIVKSYIMKSEPGEWYKQIEKSISADEGDSYSHSSNVSTFAALFSIGLEVGKPEDLAVAGLFHDIGLSDVPKEILDKDPSEWTEEEKKIWQMHPEFSINAMKAKKLIVPTEVQNAILSHHERFDGTGFPKGVAGKRFKPEAQVLAIADQFDYLTRVEEGKERMTAKKALQRMAEKRMFDPELLKKAMEVMPG